MLSRTEGFGKLLVCVYVLVTVRQASQAVPFVETSEGGQIIRKTPCEIINLPNGGSAEMRSVEWMAEPCVGFTPVQP